MRRAKSNPLRQPRRASHRTASAFAADTRVLATDDGLERLGFKPGIQGAELFSEGSERTCR
jgi:hypothetical protein